MCPDCGDVMEIRTIRTIQLKRRFGKFFYNKENTEEVVFALYEDIDGYVHFKFIDYDTDKYQMLSQIFFNKYERLYERLPDD